MNRVESSGPAHGFLTINKAKGHTSTGVVRAVKRITGCRKVGHGGTLDPAASGVLPVCLGQATRFAESALHGSKAYTMTVRLGVATDTYDAEGEPTNRVDPSGITRKDIEKALEPFRGSIQQVPPMYSALKKNGKRLYDLARAGIEVERKPRKVEVHALEMTGWQPPDFVLEVECGSGFYARSLAHDIGVALGNAAHLLDLVRTRSGPFRIEDTVTLEKVEAAANEGEWRSLLKPIDTALQDLRVIVLDPLQTEQVRNGQVISAGTLVGSNIAGPEEGESARAYGPEGELVALLVYRAQGFSWQPRKVIATD